MTLPSPLSDLDAESGAEPQLSRVTLVVGGLRLDLGLPGSTGISAFIGDVIDIANEQIAAAPGLADVAFDGTDGKWTLARLGGEPIDPDRSLAEAGVYDGELLVIRDVTQPARPMLFDDIEDAGATAENSALASLSRHGRLLTGCGVGLAATLTAAFLLPARAEAVGPAARLPTGSVPAIVVPAIVLGLGLLGVIVACVLAYRSAAQRSEWLAAVSVPLVFSGSLFVVPGAYGAKSLPMAFGLTALASLLMLLISGRGRALHTAVIALAAIGGLSSTAVLLFDAPERAVGALVATVSVLVVYLSPRVTILLAKLPVPRVPTAGEPLDDIETQGGTAVEGVSAIGKQIIPTEEGMVVRVRRAGQYLTGMLVAAAVAAAAGCYLAVDVSDGFYWQGVVFAMTVATVLCLRGRSHHDLAQSATLIAAGMSIAVVAIVKVAVGLDGWRLNAALALVLLAMLIVACGVIAPRLEFSPVMRRQVEILEFFAIALVFPLCCWIIRLYAVFRELRI